jgi:PIN like domain
VKIFFDEDVGKGIPRALRLVNVPGVDNIGKGRRIKRGTPDEVWLPHVGQQGYLLFSFNTGILYAEAQRQLLISEQVGAVFLTTGQERAANVLRLILNEWGWLETVDASTPRPFAYLLTMGGRKTLVDLHNPEIHHRLRGR